MKCFRYNQPGHHSNECPQKRAANFITDCVNSEEEYDLAPDSDLDNVELVKEHEEYRAIFIMQRLLLTLSKQHPLRGIPYLKQVVLLTKRFVT